MSFQRIIIGMDFSETAIAAAKWASTYFAPAAELVLVHVIEPADRPRFALHRLPSPDVVETAARDYAATRMQEVMTFLTPSVARREVRVGKPNAVISELAREVNADLIVVGPHGDRPRPSKFLGTAAERLVRSSTVPVLVATIPPASAPHNLLVAIDDSDNTPRVLEYARDLATAFDAEVTLLHVWSNAVYSHVASMSYATADSESEARAEIHRTLSEEGARWLRKLAATGLPERRVTAAVTYGKPGDAVVDMARAMAADLVVMGRQGSGLVAPAILGSTVSTVLHGVRCPVLVVTEEGA